MTNSKMRIMSVAPCMLVMMAVVSPAWAAPDVADLIYNPGAGNVWLNAHKAAGGVITSFQFENDEGTFIPGNYVGPAVGTYGGIFEDVTTKVIGDSDWTFTGFSGTHNFGNVFPAGMNLAQLAAYLTTRVYTGARGTGQRDVELKILFPGDTDLDGDVDAADYITVKSHMGQLIGADITDGDFDFDGDVDWDDLQFLQDSYGTTSAGAGDTIPEPGSAMLLMFGAAALLRRRRAISLI